MNPAPPQLLAEARNPFIRWEWLVAEWDQIQAALVEHLTLTMLAMALGMVISALPHRHRAPLPMGTHPDHRRDGLIYTLPSVALFALFAPVFGNLARPTAVIPLAAYTLLILVTNNVAGFRAVPLPVRDAANGMGLSPARRIATVELPLALPFIFTGIRIATVSTVGLVTVAAIVGQGGLGGLIFSGLRRAFWTPMTVGATLSIIVALLLDGLIYPIGAALTPWTRRTGSAEPARAPSGRS